LWWAYDPRARKRRVAKCEHKDATGLADARPEAARYLLTPLKPEMGVATGLFGAGIRQARNKQRSNQQKKSVHYYFPQSPQ
jgi:hypothetical protein